MRTPPPPPQNPKTGREGLWHSLRSTIWSDSKDHLGPLLVLRISSDLDQIWRKTVELLVEEHPGATIVANHGKYILKCMSSPPHFIG